MQLLPRYLVSNRIDIIANLAGFTTEYRQVYKRQALIYKGIDNVLEFKLLNVDQKPIDTQGYTPKFKAFDENNNLVIERDGVSLDDGSSAARGLFTVTISENDILDIAAQFLKYTIFLVDTNGQNILTYTDTHFGIESTIKISEQAFPGAQVSKVVDAFVETTADSGIYVSSVVDAQPGINGNEAVHTAAVYATGYTGDVTVQATLENQVTGTTNWADITSVTFAGNETEPKPVTFNGVFSFVRFATNADPTNTISKILVRN